MSGDDAMSNAIAAEVSALQAVLTATEQNAVRYLDDRGGSPDEPPHPEIVAVDCIRRLVAEVAQLRAATFRRIQNETLRRDAWRSYAAARVAVPMRTAVECAEFATRMCRLEDEHFAKGGEP